MNFGAVIGLALAAFVAVPFGTVRLFGLLSETDDLPGVVGVVFGQLPIIWLALGLAAASLLVIGASIWFSRVLQA